MTSIRKSHISVAGYKTKERFDNLKTLSEKVKEKENDRPRNIGLLVTPEKLAEFIYVRVSECDNNSNRQPSWTKRKQTKDDVEYLIGWKFLNKNKERNSYEFEQYVLRAQDFPTTSENYNPNFTNSPDGEDTFLIPHEGIPVEEMLNRMLGVSKEVLVDNSIMYKIYE